MFTKILLMIIEKVMNLHLPFEGFLEAHFMIILRE